MNKKIINQLLLNGKSAVSEKIWLKSIKFFDKSFIKNNKKLINQALINVTLLLKMKELNNNKKRSQSKEFPYIVNNKNRISLALKFFLGKTKNKNEVKVYKRLVTDLLAAANKSGVVTNKRKSLYEYAYLKKKYFYYRWF
jgi:ribosomal protein S7